MINQENMKKEYYDLLVLNFDKYYRKNVTEKYSAMEKKAVSKVEFHKKADDELHKLKITFSSNFRKFIGSIARKMIEEKEQEEIEDRVWEEVEAEIQKITDDEFREGMLWGETEDEMHDRKSLELDRMLGFDPLR